MICNDRCKFLSTEQNAFKAKDGRDVTFYRLSLISESDHKPITLTCTKEVHEFALTLAYLQDVYVEVELYENGNYVKQRVSFIGDPVQGDAYDA